MAHHVDSHVAGTTLDAHRDIDLSDIGEQESVAKHVNVGHAVDADGSAGQHTLRPLGVICGGGAALVEARRCHVQALLVVVAIISCHDVGSPLLGLVLLGVVACSALSILRALIAVVAFLATSVAGVVGPVPAGPSTLPLVTARHGEVDAVIGTGMVDVHKRLVVEEEILGIGDGRWIQISVGEEAVGKFSRDAAIGVYVRSEQEHDGE